MKTVSPGDLPVHEIFSLLLGAVAPRPIAFASTIDKEGNPNLSPFSFFNIFGANPPTLIFSPSRRGRDNTTKNTFDNVREVPEVVINLVTYAMVQQVNLASAEYPKGVNEFIKAGFTPEGSELVKPFRVKESPVQLECMVKQVIETGDKGGAGNLVICEIVRMHISESILDANGKIDQQKTDLVARMGGSWYCRASGSALFEVPKPLDAPAIGIDSLPAEIRNSHILTGNELGMMGNLVQFPTDELIRTHQQDAVYQEINSKQQDINGRREALHLYARELLLKGDVIRALCVCIE